ncbi:UvrD-helicase domain-containing protein [Chloroflexota bacterium]
MPLSTPYLTLDQRSIIEQPIETHVFLEGLAGTGKSTVGVERIIQLLVNGIPGNQILLLVPQRTLAAPYYEVLRSPGIPAGSTVTILTIGGLARRMVELFWPIIADQASFDYPDHPPTFLTLESAQYYMAHLVRPLLEEGYFDSLTIDRNRIYSQILDNLNKAAAVGFSHNEIGTRLKTAWVGEPAQTRVYEDAQNCANIFRDFCLAHNLLDFSLQLELFRHLVWPSPICHDYLIHEYRHLIVDNLEENIPIFADLLHEWLPNFESTLLVYDQDGGYRQFLSADPETNYSLKEHCQVHAHLIEGFVSSEGISLFGNTLSNTLNPHFKASEISDHQSPNSTLPVYHSPLDTRYYPEMLDWVTEEISSLVYRGISPGEIVVLAPYLSDSLRYSLVTRLNRFGIPSRSHRPSRALREEPAARCLLTLASLAHPQWGFTPPKSDVAYTLIQAIEDLDLVRAQLLTDSVYQNKKLASFDLVKSNIQERITYVIGGRYEILRGWLAAYTEDNSMELDHFLNRLFGEVISQPGFGFNSDYNAAAVSANLVESIRKFRWAVGDVLTVERKELGPEYLRMVEDGVIAAQYLGSWADQPDEAVYLAPAYTFLMSNRPVDVQFWLDVGGRGWYERLNQPLTHPHVLSRHWIEGSPWTDTEEFTANQAVLRRLVLGLSRRCREAIYLGLSGVNEQGYEHKGELLRGIDQTLRALS